jgi:hypothetical protein
MRLTLELTGVVALLLMAQGVKPDAREQTAELAGAGAVQVDQ